jgi:predicted RNA binding protein YcfA (HicA-like mRNA interferase family)
MNRKKLLGRLTRGNLRNVAFADMVNLVEGFGFQLARVRGSHHVFTQPTITEMLNLQEVGGEAKPYQIRQFLRVVEKHNLRLED